jgi:hypothetical protein
MAVWSNPYRIMLGRGPWTPRVFYPRPLSSKLNFPDAPIAEGFISKQPAWGHSLRVPPELLAEYRDVSTFQLTRLKYCGI